MKDHLYATGSGGGGGGRLSLDGAIYRAPYGANKENFRLLRACAILTSLIQNLVKNCLKSQYLNIVQCTDGHTPI